MNWLVRSTNWWRRSARDEDGGLTVEFVLWVPIFVLIMGLVVDVTMIMTQHSRFYDIARDATRQVALGISTKEQAKADLETRLAGTGFTVTVDEDAEYATTTITASITDVVMFGGAFPFDGDLTASVSMFREAAVSSGGDAGS